jgi:hypothetical protein
MRAYRTYRLPIASVVAASLAAAAAPAPVAAEGWWPGGSKDKTAAEGAAADETAMVDSSAFKLTWPKVEMPKFSWKGEEGKEGVGSVTPEGNPISRALDKVSESSKNAANNVRNAWGAAVDKLPFGGDDAKVAQKDDQPGFWSRLFSPAEEPRGSETMQEFLAQERVGTVR